MIGVKIWEPVACEVLMLPTTKEKIEYGATYWSKLWHVVVHSCSSSLQALAPYWLEVCCSLISKWSCRLLASHGIGTVWGMQRVGNWYTHQRSVRESPLAEEPFPHMTTVPNPCTTNKLLIFLGPHELLVRPVIGAFSVVIHGSCIDRVCMEV